MTKEIISKKRIKWTEEMIHAEALRYTTRHAFGVGSRRAYAAARRAGVLDAVCSHMEAKYITWTEENIHAEALRYNSRGAFAKGCTKAYDAAKLRGLLDVVCSHMLDGYARWTPELIRAEALKYDSRRRFQEGSNSAYQLAFRYKIVDDVCSHMDPLKNSWTIEMIQAEALKYDTRLDFFKNSSAYKAASRLGVIDDVCGHMPDPQTGFQSDKPGTLYYLKVNGGAAYKIGITNRSIQERFSAWELEIIEVIKTWDYKIGADAYIQEQRILKEFAYAKYTGNSLLDTGNTELFTHDVLMLDCEVEK